MTATDHRFNASVRWHLHEAGVTVDARRVDLSTDKTIDAGVDRRGYRFVAVQLPGRPFRIAAGCHCFTLRDARRHWTTIRGHDADHAAEIAALVDRIETEARALKGTWQPRRARLMRLRCNEQPYATSSSRPRASSRWCWLRPP